MKFILFGLLINIIITLSYFKMSEPLTLNQIDAIEDFIFNNKPISFVPLSPKNEKKFNLYLNKIKDDQNSSYYIFGTDSFTSYSLYKGKQDGKIYIINVNYENNIENYCIL